MGNPTPTPTPTYTPSPRPTPEPSTQCDSGFSGSRSPSSVAELITVVNDLPKPLTLPCLLEALAGPFELNAALSIQSPQPAFGTDNPRIFVVLPGPSTTLTLALVPDGPTKNALELGEDDGSGNFIPGELVFPITANVAANSAYAAVLNSGRTATTCRRCHTNDQQAGTLDGVPYFRLNPFRPRPQIDVPVTPDLQRLSDDCVVGTRRCQTFRALFAQPPSQYQFSFGIPFF